MSSSIPPSIMNQINSIEGELQELQMEVQASPNDPSTLAAYNKVKNDLNNLLASAQKDHLPPELVFQLQSAMVDLTSAVKGGKFTSDAVTDISLAFNDLSSINEDL